MLLRSGVNVAFAQTVSTLEPMVLGSLEVRSRLQLSGIPEHFLVDLEIYAMVSLYYFIKSFYEACVSRNI